MNPPHGADIVYTRYGKLYPETLPQVERFQRCIGYAGYYNSFMYNAYAREQQRQQTARNAGNGGGGSFDGGFSVGGGGGTR